MFGVVFVRRLREGKTYADFHDAWYPEVGFGRPARILSGPGTTDPRDIVTVGFVDASPDQFDDLGRRVAESEAKRHDRIAEVIESTDVRMIFEISGDDDFSDTPRPVAPPGKGFPWNAG